MHIVSFFLSASRIECGGKLVLKTMVYASELIQTETGIPNIVVSDCHHWLNLSKVNPIFRIAIFAKAVFIGINKRKTHKCISYECFQQPNIT